MTKTIKNKKKTWLQIKNAFTNIHKPKITLIVNLKLNNMLKASPIDSHTIFILHVSYDFVDESNHINTSSFFSYAHKMVVQIVFFF